MRLYVVACIVAAMLLFTAGASAETWQAPVGGAALDLGDGRVACAGDAGEWKVEQDGRAVRPPPGEDAVGRLVELHVAANATTCASSVSKLTLVATGRFPAIDPDATTLFVDDARVELQGRGLKGAAVVWHFGGRSGVDYCVQPQFQGAVERCAVAVGHGFPAVPNGATLELLAAGARTGSDVVTWDAAGRRLSRDETALRIARIVVSSLVPPAVSIDLAGGTASRIPLVHPETIAGADCGAASCTVSDGVIVVGGLATVSSGLAVRLRLAPRVQLQRGDLFESAPVVQVPVLPCAMSLASGDALRDVDATRAVVRVDARCASEARGLRWFSAGRALDVLSFVDAGSATYVLLGVGRVEGDDLVITASRGGADASIVGQARGRTRAVPPLHASLVLEGGQAVDFVPTNRPAAVSWGRVEGDGDLVLQPLEGVYSVIDQAGTTLVQGERGAGGFVALRFARRVPKLPGPLATADLAVVVDPVQRPIHEANVPTPLGASSLGHGALAELVCGAGPTLRSVAPGATAHVPYDERSACRVVFHRELLAPSDGAQTVQLDVDVTRVDGTVRPEAHVSQAILLRASAEPRIAWISTTAAS